MTPHTYVPEEWQDVIDALDYAVESLDAVITNPDIEGIGARADMESLMAMLEDTSRKWEELTRAYRLSFVRSVEE